MSENRKYYYLKLKENFFTTEKMVILESAQDGLLYSNLLLKMYLMSLKSGGILMLGDGLPHTPQTGTRQKDAPALVKKIGKTTYVVRVHFSETSRETMSNKIKRMLKNEVEQM